MTCKNTHHSLNALNAEAKKSIDICSFMIAAYQVNICGILDLPRKYKRFRNWGNKHHFPTSILIDYIEYATWRSTILVGLSSQNNEQMKIPTNSHYIHIIH